ncbi:TonB-dependent receptor [Janthinobacterium sp. 17J80-10]|uniref:TonB-dependent receptor n=1 Tax=Janthinobacterium sp. 17J80-10 TaxID=2497863 RepID=UPI0013E8997C|nr:TonB-dependent receptor [Janthinobacterium sp. 17J80-10]
MRRTLLAQAVAQACIASLAGTVLAGSAYAADVDKPRLKLKANQEETANVLNSVVVTSQKREENIEDVPLPITAITGNAILEKNITTSADIERLAPNLSAQSSGGRASKPRWFLRGIGTNDPNANNEGPLGIYVDEVVVGLQGNQNFPIFDLERVEVLRGPQGTLWGKNNTGGAIHFVSKKPTIDNEGYTKVGVGNYGSRTVEGAFGGAIHDEVVAARGSFYYEKGDGWSKNLASGENGPSLQDFAARFQVLANPTPDLEALLSIRLRQRDGGNTPTKLVGATSVGGVTTPNVNGAIAQGGGLYVPPYGANPTATSEYWAGDGYNKQDSNGATLKVNWELGQLTLTSITAFDNSTGKSYSAVGNPPGTTLDQSSSRGTDSSRQVTQELRLSSPRDQRLSWIAGAYYYNQNARVNNQGARFNNTEQYTESSWDQDSISTALFGNVRYAVTDKAAVTLGLRHTRERKNIVETALTATDNAGGANVVFNNANAWWLPGAVTGTAVVAAQQLSSAANWTKTTWDITPEYRFSKDLLGYARVATGFRSGGFNQSIVNNSIRQTNPETIVDYELGLKSSWLDGRVTANIAAFYYDIKNLQLNIQQIVPGTTITSTAGSSDGNIKGIELEVQALPTERLRIGAGLGLLRSGYTDFIYSVGPVQLNASGNEFYRTPRVSLRLDAEYRIPLTTGGEVLLGTDWSYRSHIFHNATVQNDPIQETPAYWNGNLRVGYLTANKKTQVTAFVNNVTDQSSKVLSQIVNTRGVFPTSFAPPRQYGAQATIYY